MPIERCVDGRIAAGPRPMLVGAGVGSVLAAVAVGAKQLWESRK